MVMTVCTIQWEIHTLLFLMILNCFLFCLTIVDVCDLNNTKLLQGQKKMWAWEDGSIDKAFAFPV